MNLTELSMKRPVTTLMFFLCFVLTGGIAARLLPLEYFPEVQFPGIFIQIPYPGSTPEEVERLVTRPVEEVLATISGIKRLRSTTTPDNAQIQVMFDWDSNAVVKGIEAREKIDAIRHQLPSDLQRLFVFTGRTSDAPMLQIRISSDSIDLSRAYELLDRKLKRAIEGVPGVSQVRLEGVEPLQVEIALDPVRVAAHKVRLDQLSAQLMRQNFSISAGEIFDGNSRLRVKPIGEWQSLDEIAALPIDKSGLKLGDIAQISIVHPPKEVGRHIDMKDAIGLSITRESNANLVDTTRRVLDKITAIGNSPDFKGIDLFFMDNQAEGVVNSLSDIISGGLLGFALSVFVLYAFLRNWILTLIVSLSVPFAVLITLAFMYFAGLTLNILSMMGLMLAIGMLVDNAVVVTESVFRHERLHPEDRWQAVLAGTRHVGLAVATGTLTTVIVFLPNIIGEKIDITVFLSHVAWTITIALAASLLIALTIIPLLLYRLPLGKFQEDAGWLVWLTNKYANSLAFLCRHPRWSALIAVAILASVILPFSLVKKEMFEQNIRTRIRFDYELDARYTVDRVEQEINKLEQWLLPQKNELDIDTVYSFFTSEEAGTTVLLKNERSSGKTSEEIRDHIQKNMPAFPLGKVHFSRENDDGSEDLRVTISGDSTERLTELSLELARMMRGVEGLRDIRSEAQLGDFELRVRIDRARAKALDLSPSVIAQAIGVALRGQPLRTMRTDTGETQVRLAFSKANRATLADLENLPVFRPNGEKVPLTAVADIQMQRGAQQIRREFRMTTIGVNASADGISGEEARKRLEPVIEALELPPGYKVGFGGGFNREDEAGKVFAMNMLLALMMVYLVMAAMFESLIFPTAVIFSIFYAVVGVFWFFWITQTTLSMMANIGILVLMGVVVNNGIVLIDHINQLRKDGVDRQTAILTAGRERLRPILMTTATTVLGLVPLCIGTTTIGGDDNSPAYFPMARAVVGGLTFSTIISLLILPVIYIGLDNLREWNSRVWREGRQRAAGKHKLPAA